MALSRRQLLKTAGGLAASYAVLPAMARAGAAYGKTPAHPHTLKRNRLVVIHLMGGVDGLSTVVPVAGRKRDVYRKVRPYLALDPRETLPLDRWGDASRGVALNRRLGTLHKLYDQGRVAIVQGVDYPRHNYSHFASADIWHSGEPDRAPDSGWLGRHLDRVGIGEGELRGVGIGYGLPLILRGHRRAGLQLASIAATRFADGTGAVADARHDALALFDHHARSEPLRAAAGHGARQAVDLVDVLSRVPAAKPTGNDLADALLAARTLLGLDLGVEVVFATTSAFDTHTGQAAALGKRLDAVDDALEAFFYGTVNGKRVVPGPLPYVVAKRTMVLIVSEFGRRIGENGTGADAGTDHGAAQPVFLIGPPPGSGHGVVPGLYGDHPYLGTVKGPADNLMRTTEMRRVYQTLLTEWLHDPDPLYRAYPPLPGLVH